jgi:multiple sugar transport system ATP-binding protein
LLRRDGGDALSQRKTDTNLCHSTADAGCTRPGLQNVELTLLLVGRAFNLSSGGGRLGLLQFLNAYVVFRNRNRHNPEQLHLEAIGSKRALHQRLKVTTVYVTHDQIEAMTMADKIVVMNHGHIEQAGAPLELYDRPANLFVAGFIGSPAMNMLHGRVEGGGFVDASGARWPLPPGHGAADGMEVVYGVRPEHLRLDAAGIPTKVHVVEPTGSETQVVLRLGDVSLMGAFRERITQGPGEALPVSPEIGLIHLFDKKTGKRI